MSKYTFTFKKNDIFVEFSTTDKEIVEKQFQIWVASADDYAKNRQNGNIKPANITPSQPKKEENKNIESLPDKIEEKSIQEIPSIEQQPEILDKASSLLKTINTIQEEKEIPQVAQNNFAEENIAETVNFEAVLEKTIENPSFEPIKTKDQIFLNLVNSKNTTDKFHYLIITAYYLSEFEKLERFSLKQINAKLMQNLSAVIDHVTLQEAINQNFIELIPDLTGVSEVGEYRLTPKGEDFFANKI